MNLASSQAPSPGISSAGGRHPCASGTLRSDVTSVRTSIGKDSSFEDVRTREVHGISLAYRECGEGSPVVFVHGALSDLRTWSEQLLAIGARHRAIAYSRRHACPNQDMEAGRDDDPLQPHVEDLAAFLREVDAQGGCLVGHSLGAFICLLVALRHPDLVRSMVLMEPPVLPLLVSTPPRPQEMLRLFVRRPYTTFAIAKFGATAFGPAQKAFREGDDERAHRAFAHGVMGRSYYEAMSPSRMKQVWDNKSGLRGQILGSGFPDLHVDAIRQMEVPTLLVMGKHSAIFLRQLVKYLHELMPRSELVEIPAASHMMHEDNAQAASEAILRFLQRIDG